MEPDVDTVSAEGQLLAHAELTLARARPDQCVRALGPRVLNRRAIGGGAAACSSRGAPAGARSSRDRRCSHGVTRGRVVHTGWAAGRRESAVVCSQSRRCAAAAAHSHGAPEQLGVVPPVVRPQPKGRARLARAPREKCAPKVGVSEREVTWMVARGLPVVEAAAQKGAPPSPDERAPARPAPRHARGRRGGRASV